MPEFRHHHPDLIAEVTQYLGLQGQTFVEKDLFVTKTIEIISQLENEYFKTIFAGGTCLAKAHKLINRVSEDVDFKITQKEPAFTLSKESQRRALKSYHTAIIKALEKEGFIINPDKVLINNERKYAQIQLTYPSFYDDSRTLRPHILIELAVSNPKLATTFLPVNSMIGEYLNVPENNPVECISILETAAEKWVALTRQTSAVDRSIYEPDRNIVRHLYDLHEIEAKTRLGKDFIDLVAETVKQDAKKFGRQHQEYLQNPLKETERAIEMLKSPLYQQYYEDYVIRMVIDKEPLTYSKALASFERLSEKACQSLAQLSVSPQIEDQKFIEYAKYWLEHKALAEKAFENIKDRNTMAAVHKARDRLKNLAQSMARDLPNIRPTELSLNTGTPMKQIFDAVAKGDCKEAHKLLVLKEIQEQVRLTPTQKISAKIKL